MATPIIIISILTSVTMILTILFKPKIKINKFEIETYWIICLIGALILVIFNLVSLESVGKGLTANTAINPLKILSLFVSMTVLSVFLDEIGFFKYIASIAVKKAKNNQFVIFLYLYIATSILTVFTSNDIIILTLTPFICYFAKNAKISPIPYLVSEFIAANTWSMVLIIGNPTNIYLATKANINFVEYFKVMAIPAIAGSLVAFGILLLLFKKKLSEPIEKIDTEAKIEDKFLLIIGLIHLSLCTVLLAVSSYIGLEMWLITICFALSLLIIVFIYCLIKNKGQSVLSRTLKRAPWTLIPFVISMFVIVLALTDSGVTSSIAKILGTKNTVYRYGFTSLFTANVINNIPMCVLFTEIIGAAPIGIKATEAIYSSIIGSNIGAFLSPIGALAGIMWMSILKKNEVKYTFFDFVKYGFILAIPATFVSLLILSLIL